MSDDSYEGGPRTRVVRPNPGGRRGSDGPATQMGPSTRTVAPARGAPPPRREPPPPRREPPQRREPPPQRREPPPPRREPSQQRRRSPEPPPPPPPVHDDGAGQGGGGLNPLVLAATPVLMLATGLRGTEEHRDVDGLYHHIIGEIGAYEEDAQAAGLPEQTILDARYALCTFIDEVVMNTPWGNQSIWATQPLLLHYHGSTRGGEVIFRMIEDQIETRDPDVDLMELLYACISLGFEGQYRVSDGGQRELAEIRERLYRRIRSWREPPRTDLSAHWQGVHDRRSRLVREVPAWVLFGAAVLIASGVYIALRTTLSSAAAPALAELNGVRKTAFEATPCVAPVAAQRPAVAAGPTLAGLLASEPPDIIAIDEDGRGKTTLILRGEMFASGSAEVSSDYDGILDRISQALAVVGGRVQVEGHSDNVPVRSLRFQDNHQLSAKRAESAAKILQRKLPPGKVSISFLGLGPDEPRYLPAEDPANQALNRRIEIVHLDDRSAG